MKQRLLPAFSTASAAVCRNALHYRARAWQDVLPPAYSMVFRACHHGQERQTAALILYALA
jgi:hypothetical protein